jgi:hypothetical protein
MTYFAGCTTAAKHGGAIVASNSHQGPQIQVTRRDSAQLRNDNGTALRRAWAGRRVDLGCAVRFTRRR